MILRFQKIALLNKIVTKTRSTNNQENSAHNFADNYVTNYLANVLQIGLNPEELELLEYALDITFLKENL